MPAKLMKHLYKSRWYVGPIIALATWVEWAIDGHASPGLVWTLGASRVYGRTPRAEDAIDLLQ